MKRTISVLLAVLLSVSVMFSIPAFAATDNEPTFAVSTKSANPGKKVNVTIRLIHNPGVASVRLKAHFDSALTLNSVTYNTALGGRSQQPETFTDPVTLNWFNGDANTTGDMIYATLNFTVAKNATVGMHEVYVTYDEDDVYDTDENNITFKTVSGGVNVVISVKGIALDHTSATLKTGDGNYTLTPIFTPTNATNRRVTWSSSDESVATVEGGVVTPLKKGTAVIAAKSDDGGFEATCDLTVLCSHISAAPVRENEVPASCTGEGGYDEVVYCGVCGEELSRDHFSVPPTGHSYGAPKWTWTGYDSAKAVFSCIQGDNQRTINAEITSEITKSPTLNAEGERTYRAAVIFDGKTYTDVKIAVLPKLYVLGDVNGDGRADISDATIVQRAGTNVKTPFPDEQLMHGDVNGDGRLDVVDATLLQRYATRVSVLYPIGEIRGN